MSAQWLGGLAVAGLMLLVFGLVRLIFGNPAKRRGRLPSAADGPFESAHDWHIRQNTLLHGQSDHGHNHHHHDGGFDGGASDSGGSDGGGGGGAGD